MNLAIPVSMRKDFSQMSKLRDYSEILQGVKKAGGINLLKMSEMRETESKSLVKRLGVRHDIDSDLETALRMAKIENKYGVFSTYYVLHTAKYYWSDYLVKRSPKCLHTLRQIQELGHEIGLHNDSLGVLVDAGISPQETLETELSFLRNNSIVVSGTASHGSFHQYNASNYEVFKGLSINNRTSFKDKNGKSHHLNYIDMKDLDLTYEANYILDSKLISSEEYLAKYGGKFVSNTDFIDWMTRDYDLQWGIFGKDFWIETNEKTGEVKFLSQGETIEKIVFSEDYLVGVLDSHPEYFGNSKSRFFLHSLYRILKGLLR